MKRPKKTLVSRSASSFNEEVSQTLSISANDGAMVHTLTTSLPSYNSRGEPQKLYEFIHKHDDFFDVAELIPSLVLVLALAKLNGPAYLWWHNHISKYSKSDEGCMRTWEDLKKGLIAAFIPLESEIVLLNQLKTLRQNSMTVTDFNAKFNQLMMQVDLCPMEEISYYLDSLQKEICKAVEANLLNIIDIESLKLAALRQDRIENPQQHKNVVAEESAFTSDMTKHEWC